MTNKRKIIYYIVALIVSSPAWVWMFLQDWKTTLAILLILWGNNLTTSANNT